MIARILRSASSPGSCPSSFSGTIFCPPGSILRALSAAQPTAPAICPLASRGKTLSALEWTDYNLRLRKNKSPDGEVGRGLTIFEINTQVPSRRPVWPAPVIDGHYGHIQSKDEPPCLAGRVGKLLQLNVYKTQQTCSMTRSHPKCHAAIKTPVRPPTRPYIPSGGTGLLVEFGPLHPERDSEDKNWCVGEVPSVG